MNKLLILYLLSFTIFYIHCGTTSDTIVDTTDTTTDTIVDTTDTTTETTTNTNAPINCKGAQIGSDGGKVKSCDELIVSDSSKKKCQKNNKGTACEEVDKETKNSGKILNVFNITFILIIIFSIL